MFKKERGSGKNEQTCGRMALLHTDSVCYAVLESMASSRTWGASKSYATLPTIYRWLGWLSTETSMLFNDLQHELCGPLDCSRSYVTLFNTQLFGLDG